jgi:GNAT superfamily N-acetyltransferase
VTPEVVTAAERPDGRLGAPTDGIWPEYNLHGDVLNRYWGDLEDRFGDFQFVLLDDDSEEVVAYAQSAPLAWDGTVEGLPPGIDGGIQRAFEGEDAPNTLCALVIGILPEYQGRGLSGRMLREMGDIGRLHGLGALIAPVRPSWKERYPLTPIERYATWTRADGLPFDPWQRVHARMGGEILLPEPRSLHVTGTVSEWESWTELVFPESGEYVFPRGLALLAVDRDADECHYWEPNVWTRHDLS